MCERKRATISKKEDKHERTGESEKERQEKHCTNMKIPPVMLEPVMDEVNVLIVTTLLPGLVSRAGNTVRVRGVVASESILESQNPLPAVPSVTGPDRSLKCRWSVTSSSEVTQMLWRGSSITDPVLGNTP